MTGILSSANLNISKYNSTDHLQPPDINYIAPHSLFSSDCLQDSAGPNMKVSLWQPRKLFYLHGGGSVSGAGRSRGESPEECPLSNLPRDS